MALVRAVFRKMVGLIRNFSSLNTSTCQGKLSLYAVSEELRNKLTHRQTSTSYYFNEKHFLGNSSAIMTRRKSSSQSYSKPSTSYDANNQSQSNAKKVSKENENKTYKVDLMNVSISQIDPDILEQMPEDIRQGFSHIYLDIDLPWINLA